MEASREKTIIKTSVIGVIANVFLAGFKAVIGLMTKLHRHFAGRGQQHFRRGHFLDYHRRDEAGW